MTGSAQIREAIAARLETVPAIGRVHRFERYAMNEGPFRTFYAWESGGTTHIRGWYVRRIGFRRRPHLNSTVLVTTEWRIAGFLAVVDEAESEIVMDALVDAATAAFALDLTLGGLLNPEPAQAGAERGLQLLESRPYMLANVLCHGVQLGLTTEHNEREYDESALADLVTIHANWELPPRDLTGPALPDDEDAAATDRLTNLNQEEES
ncbi:hypothetical protein [Parvibaculum sp.]|uniref:hypothetical protein n=1 Tax=Parvibaculum sp. TaxID=2024848 RepID=UPI0027344614|nr:hypothetical protein [Parvibaculum sp.]MDP3329417.1 hypothetical protein [Parvibaculum sp.]